MKSQFFLLVCLIWRDFCFSETWVLRYPGLKTLLADRMLVDVHFLPLV